MTMNDLKSSVAEKGETVDEIFQFSHGNKKTFRRIITSSIQQSEFTRFDLENGHRIYINPQNVDWFEVVPEGVNGTDTPSEINRTKETVE